MLTFFISSKKEADVNILLITTSFPVSENGSEAAGSFVKDFADTLSGQGHKVGVMAPITGKELCDQKSSIHYFWFSVPKLPLSLLSPKKPQDWPLIVSTLKQGKKVVDQAVTTFKPDHVFALWALPSGHWARYAKKRYGVPYSIWALGSDIWSLGKVPVVKSYLRTVLKDASNCFADGYQLAEDVKKISNKPCEFLPSTRQLPVCGLPLTNAQPPYRLCFLGRWHPNKGIDLLLEVLHLLEDKDWKNIEEVRIAGGGPMEGDVKEQVKKLQGKGRAVSLSGFQDKLGAAELLIWTDYVIIPSRIESIPVIFSDAMQAMRPVIAMPVGDLPGLIEKYNCGVLSVDVTVEAFVTSIRTRLDKPVCDFSKGIESALENFILNKITKKYINKVR